MVEEVLTELFRIEIPLPENPLKSLNSYVIRGEGSYLIIDTGLNREECLVAMKAGLNELGIDLEKTYFFITHMHADHLALVSRLATDTNRVYFNRPDAEILENRRRWASVTTYAGMNGFPEDKLRAVLNNHPGLKYGLESIPELTFLKEGDRLNIGNYFFKCIETPGHSKGHICLYEPEKKIFVAGDHILNDITPNIQCWTNNDNLLKNYLASLDKVYELQVDLVLPGHRDVFRDFRGRIKELKMHHKSRLDEILLILSNGPRNAFQIASEMTWDINYDSWDLFPVMQKWFATGEAIAHLRYLEEEGRVYRKMWSNIITFSLHYH